MGVRTTSNWTEEELLVLISAWQREESNVLLRGEKEAEKRARIYKNYVNQINSEPRNPYGIVTKMQRLRKWFAFVNEYNRIENPNNTPELDWFQLSKNKQDTILKENKLQSTNYSKKIYDALAGFLDVSSIPQHAFETEKTTIVHQPYNSPKNEGTKLQYNDISGDINEMLHYFGALETPTKRKKGLFESFNQEHTPSFDETFNELIITHQKEMQTISEMIIKKHTDSIQRQIAQHNELIKEEIGKYNKILCASLFKEIKEKLINKRQKVNEYYTNEEKSMNRSQINNAQNSDQEEAMDKSYNVSTHSANGEGKSINENQANLNISQELPKIDGGESFPASKDADAPTFTDF